MSNILIALIIALMYILPVLYVLGVIGFKYFVLLSASLLVSSVFGSLLNNSLVFSVLFPLFFILGSFLSKFIALLKLRITQSIAGKGVVLLYDEDEYLCYITDGIWIYSISSIEKLKVGSVVAFKKNR